MNEQSMEGEIMTGNVTVMERSGPAGTLVSFRQHMHNSRDELKKMLPVQIPVERFLRVVDTAVQQNPKILEATARSIFNAAMKAATDGLLPDGREGAIVPYNVKVRGTNTWETQVQWMPMIAGLRKKVRNSGEIETWDAQVVYANDEFEYELGDDPFIKHKPMLSGDRGQVIAAYSIATLKSGEKSREVMSIGEIEAVRARSKSKDSGPWVTDYSEMCRKTVARRHSKVLPMSTDLDDLMRHDDELYDFSQPGADETKIANMRTAPVGLASKMKALANGGDVARENPPPPATPTQEAAKPEGDAADATAGVSSGERADAATAQQQDAGDRPHDEPAQAASLSAAADAPASDGLKATRKAGYEAYYNGKRRNVPQEFDRDDESCDAWFEGYDLAKAEDAGNK